jgi:hypothetical protein
LTNDPGSEAGGQKLRRSYFAAAAAWLLASARRSVFLRRVARFLTLSLPLQCPIGPHQTRFARKAQPFLTIVPPAIDVPKMDRDRFAGGVAAAAAPFMDRKRLFTAWNHSVVRHGLRSS